MWPFTKPDQELHFTTKPSAVEELHFYKAYYEYMKSYALSEGEQVKVKIGDVTYFTRPEVNRMFRTLSSSEAAKGDKEAVDHLNLIQARYTSSDDAFERGYQQCLACVREMLGKIHNGDSNGN